LISGRIFNPHFFDVGEEGGGFEAEEFCCAPKRQFEQSQKF